MGIASPYPEDTNHVSL